MLITFNGNWVLKYFFGILSTVFSVLIRALILDGAILVQVMFWMMKKRRRFPVRTFYSHKKFILLTVLFNIVGVAALYFMN